MIRTPIICLAALAFAATAEDAPQFRTDDSKDEKLPWYQLEPGVFPPENSAHYIQGELLQYHGFERKLVIRVDRNDTQQRSHWDLPLGLEMLPYGSIYYRGAPAALRELPVSTHVHTYCYVKGEDEAENPLGVDFFGRLSPEGEFRHCIRLEDDFSFHSRQNQIWKIDFVDLTENKLTATLHENGKPVEDAKTFDLLATTRAYLGDRITDLKSIKAGQKVQFNLTWVGQYGPGRIREIWLDETSRKLATAHQMEIHRQHIRERGIPGWVDKVDDDKNHVTITFFDGIDPALFEDLKKINPDPLGWPTSGGAKDDLAPKGTIAVARKSLMTYDPTNDRKGGNILETNTVPTPWGSSGVQIKVQCGMMLEGYRPTKIVRFFPASWTFIGIPREEQFYGRE